MPTAAASWGWLDAAYVELALAARVTASRRHGLSWSGWRPHGPSGLVWCVREETGTRETLLGHWTQAGVRSGEVVKQMGVFVDGRVAESLL